MSLYYDKHMRYILVKSLYFTPRLIILYPKYQGEGFKNNTIYLSNICHKQSVYCWLLYTPFIHTIHQNISYMWRISALKNRLLLAQQQKQQHCAHRSIDVMKHTDDLKIFFIFHVLLKKFHDSFQ